MSKRVYKDGRHTGKGHGPGLCKCPKHQNPLPHSRRQFLLAHGKGPHPCHFCGVELMLRDGVVHHLDEDHYNNVASNIVLAHAGCHTRHHMDGRDMNWEAMRETIRGEKEHERRSKQANEQWDRRAAGDIYAIGRRK